MSISNITTPRNPARLALLAVTLCALHGGLNAQSTLVTIAEDSSQSTSSLDNTSVFDFNDLSRGVNTNVNWDGVGSFDQVYARGATVYGGAIDETTGQTSQYSYIKRSANFEISTLTLDTASSYFGMWWSAGDASNLLTFYSGENIVAQYTTAAMFGSLDLGPEYYGNPYTGGNTREPYAFINFYGAPDTTWDSIELTTTGSGGFESDNYTSRVEGFNPETDDIEDLGQVVATVSGTETTVVSEPSEVEFIYNGGEDENWVWGVEAAAPGAPTPPLYALMAFAAAFALKDKLRQRNKDK